MDTESGQAWTGSRPQGPGGLREVTCHPRMQGQSMALCLVFSKWPRGGGGCCYLLGVPGSRGSRGMSFVLPAWSPACSGENHFPLRGSSTVRHGGGTKTLMAVAPALLGQGAPSWVSRGALWGSVPTKQNQDGAWGACFQDEGLLLATSHAHSASKRRAGVVGYKKPVGEPGITRAQPASEKGCPDFQPFQGLGCRTAAHTGGV